MSKTHFKISPVFLARRRFGLLFAFLLGCIGLLYYEHLRIGYYNAINIQQNMESSFVNGGNYNSVKSWLINNGFRLENAPSGHWVGSDEILDQAGHKHEYIFMTGFKSIETRFFPFLYWIKAEFYFENEPVSDIVARGYTAGVLVNRKVVPNCREPSERLFVPYNN